MPRLKNTLGYQWKPADSPAGSSENIFSNDEEEKEFINHVAQIKKEAWIASTMPWNTIHGIPWKRCEALGQGGYGSVYLGMRQDKKLFAVKSVKIEYPITERAASVINCQMTEVRMMRYLRSKYIVRCLGCGRSNGENAMDGQETLDVFLEYVVRGSLKHIIQKRQRPFEETPYARQYTHDILRALQYMQQQKVVHGDIKMANLLLSDDCVKLADWGGAKQLTRRTLRTLLIGTTGFRSPEVESQKMQGHPSDIFSLGCTVIEMITGSRPNRVLKNVKVKEGRLRSTVVPMFVPEIPQNASPECKDFLDHCLCYRKSDRWTASELLHHPFITNRDTTSPLPYGMAVPPLIDATLLRPIRRNHPDVSDGTMPAKVRRHLDAVSKSWVPCNPPGPQPQVPIQARVPAPFIDLTSTPVPFIELTSTPAPAAVPVITVSSTRAIAAAPIIIDLTSTPAPLPRFSADFSVDEDTHLLHEWVKAFSGGDLNLKSSSNKSPNQRARAQEPLELQRDEAIHGARSSNRFKDIVFQSSNQMELLNDEIFAEARMGHIQPLPVADAVDVAGILFPNDPGLARGRDQTSHQPDVSPNPKRRHIFGMSCAGGIATDTIQSATLPPAVKKTRKK